MELRNYFFLVFVVFLSGCAAAMPIDTRLPKWPEKAASICELASSGKLVEGAVVRIVANYKTDKSHYEYLADAACGKNGIIKISNIGLVPSESVKKFYGAADQFCATMGTPYLCVLNVNLDADIKIVQGQDGKLAADLMKIYSSSPFPGDGN